MRSVSVLEFNFPRLTLWIIKGWVQFRGEVKLVRSVGLEELGTVYLPPGQYVFYSFQELRFRLASSLTFELILAVRLFSLEIGGGFRLIHK